MAGNGGITIDDGIIEIPASELAMGFDEDGLPKTVPVKGPGDEAKEAQDKAIAEMARLKRERDDRAREASDAAGRAQVAEHRAAQEAAARRRAEEEASKNRGVAVSSHMQRMYAEQAHIETGLGAAKEQMKTLKDLLRRATADSDGDRVADITAEMATVAAEIRDYERGNSGIKDEIERHKRAFATPEQRRAAPEPGPQPEPERLTADKFIAACPPETQPWLRENPDFADPGSTANRKLLLFAEAYALDHGGNHAINTSDFVEALNAKFFPDKVKEDAVPEEKKPAAKEVEEKPAAKAKAQVAMSAPVTNDNIFSSANPNGRAVKLPPKLARFVKESGMDETKYALQAVKDIKEGKLPKNFLDPDYDHQF